MQRPKHFSAIFGCVLLYFVLLGAVKGATIDIRFIVKDTLGPNAEARQQVSEQLRAYIAELNGYYRNSAVNLHAELANVTFRPIPALEATAVLQDIKHERNGFEDLFIEARTWGADFTLAVTDLLLIDGASRCGSAYAVNQTLADLASSRTAFAVINYACGAHTLAHELGHLMGLNHGHVVAQCQPVPDNTAALRSYANGYGVGNCDQRYQEGEWGDIMVGGWMQTISGQGHKNLPLYANPRIHDPRCGVKQTCGDPLIGDAARMLNEFAEIYAKHEKSVLREE